MRGDASEMTQVIFAVLLVILVIAFMFMLEVKPSLETYGNAQARLWAKNIAYTIDAMQGVEKGSIELDFDITWDVVITCSDECEVMVEHKDIRGSKKLLSMTDEISLIGVEDIVIEKKEGQIKIRER